MSLDEIVRDRIGYGNSLRIARSLQWDSVVVELKPIVRALREAEIDALRAQRSAQERNYA